MLFSSLHYWVAIMFNNIMWGLLVAYSEHCPRLEADVKTFNAAG
jgi:hypothetical protein